MWVAVVLLVAGACAPDVVEPVVDEPDPIDVEPEPVIQGALVEVILPPRDAIGSGMLDAMVRDVQLVATVTRADIRSIRSTVPDRDVFVADLVHHLAAGRAALTCALTSGASSAVREAHANLPQKRFCTLVTSDTGADVRDGLDVVVLRTAELGHLVGAVAAAAAGDGPVATFLAPHDLEQGRFAEGLRAGLAGHAEVTPAPDADPVAEAARVVADGAQVVIVGAHPRGTEIAQAVVDAGGRVVAAESVTDGLDGVGVVLTWRILFDRALRGPVDRLVGRADPAPLDLGFAEGVFVTEPGPDASLTVSATVTRVRGALSAGTLDPFTGPPTADSSGVPPGTPQDAAP
ncbi:MAG: hypothetical protein WD041_01285 [Nitriliruptoraceae bacterium]